MSTLTLTPANFEQTMQTLHKTLYKKVQKSGEITVKMETFQTKEKDSLAQYLQSDEYKQDKSQKIDAEEFLSLIQSW